MTVSFAAIPQPASPLRRVDPRVKMAALFLAGIVAVSVQSLASCMLAVVLSSVLAWIAQIPRRWYARRIGEALVFLAPLLIFMPVFVHHDGPALHVGPVVLSLDGLALALRIVCRALAAVTLALVALCTGPLHETMRAARALGIPYLVIQLALLMYRYTHLIAEELARLRIAMRVRGFRNRMTMHTYRTYGHVVGTLLVRGHDRAERVDAAMRCRGFDGRFRSLTVFRTTSLDWMWFGVIVASAAGVAVLDFWWR